MKKRCLFVSALVFSFQMFVAEAGEQDLTISCRKERKEVEIVFRGKRLLLYSFATNQSKPYVKEFCALSGQNILRDASPDQLRHPYGLMYALRVNEVDFREGAGTSGREQPMRTLVKTKTGNTVGFTQMIEWAAHGSNIPLLYETRRLLVSIDPAQSEVALEWQSNFQVGAIPVRLTGSICSGFGLSLAEQFDHAASHLNSSSVTSPPETSAHPRRSDWSAVFGEINGSPTTVALFGTPCNPGETRFSTLVNPRGYLSVTQNLAEQPGAYKPGECFKVRYLLAAYADARNSEFLDSRRAKWLSAED